MGRQDKPPRWVYFGVGLLMAVAVVIGNSLDNGFSVVQTVVSLVIGFLGGVLIVKLVTRGRRDG